MPDENVQPEPGRRRESRSEAEEERRRRRRRHEEEEEDEDDPRFRKEDPLETLIPYRNPKALIAYYLGVFSLIPCFALLLGPAALILGILGLKYRQLHPTAGGTGHAYAGIILGSLTTLANVGVIVVFLVALGMR